MIASSTVPNVVNQFSVSKPGGVEIVERHPFANHVITHPVHCDGMDTQERVCNVMHALQRMVQCIALMKNAIVRTDLLEASTQRESLEY